MERKETQDGESQKESWQEFWDSIKDRVAVDMHAIYEKWSRAEDDVSREERVQKSIEMEEQFVKAVLSQLENILKEDSGKETVALFDIDETIGVARRPNEEGDSYVTIFRPSIMALFEYLKQSNVKMGFLTTRGKLEEQLTHPNELGPIDSFIDKRFLFASGEHGFSEDSGRFAETMKEELGGPDGVINETLLNDDNIWRYTTIGSQEKLHALATIRKTYKDQNFLVVDDFPYPEILSKRNGFYGVSLDESNKFLIR